MQSDSQEESNDEEARFVFIGTVRRLRAATMSEVPVDDSTAVVRVDEVIHAPEVLVHYAGQDITVRFDTRKRVKEGQQAMFQTNAWLFGESVAVEARDVQDVTASASRAGTRSVGDPVRRLSQRDVEARFADAKLVVSGRVTSVRLPSDVVAARSARAAEPDVRRISEHDPDWRIAEVQVDEVHKGRLRNDTVSIRFPSSEDVMWHDAPKFHPGQEGFFMLHKPEEAPRERAAVARAAPVRDKGEFVVPRAIDFQPLSDPGGIRELIPAIGGSAGVPSTAGQEEMPRSARSAKKRAPAAPRKRGR